MHETNIIINAGFRFHPASSLSFLGVIVRDVDLVQKLGPPIASKQRVLFEVYFGFSYVKSKIDLI